MAAFRFPGPICLASNQWLNVFDGTLVRTASPTPGTAQQPSPEVPETDQPYHSEVEPLLVAPRRTPPVPKPPPVEFQYEPTAEDLSHQTPKYKSAKRLSNTLVYHGGMLCVHGNSRVTVVKTGRDITKGSLTQREIRTWAAKLDTAGKKMGDYQLSLGPYGEKCFVPDTEDHGPSPVDVPGVCIVVGEIPHARRERQLQEFWYGAQWHPEYGAMYFVVITDITPDKYRLQMFDKLDISPADWTNALSRSGRKAISKQAQPLYDDKGWINAPESALRPEAPALRFDSGWVDWPPEYLPHKKTKK